MPGMMMVLFMSGLIVMSIFAPDQLKRLMGVVEAKPGQAGRPGLERQRERQRSGEPAPRSAQQRPVAPLPPPATAEMPPRTGGGGGFGRKGL